MSIDSLGLLENPHENLTQVELDVEIYGKGIDGYLPSYVINKDMYAENLLQIYGPTKFNPYWKVPEVFPYLRSESPT